MEIWGHILDSENNDYSTRNSTDCKFVTPDDSPRGGLYLHCPFCLSKCGYCDFYSVPLMTKNVDSLVNAICRELRRRLLNSSLTLESVFFGGGTPTCLNTGQLQTILAEIKRLTADQPIHEFTIEANPATVDDEKAKVLVNNGINRVSLGVQSFDESELAFLGRKHKPQDVPDAVNILRRAGVDNFNLDLIFGIPGQSLRSWQTSLEKCLELNPTHMSCYGLTYEKGTSLTGKLEKGVFQPCDEGLEAEFYLATIDRLARAGFKHYEISNFARPGFECVQNMAYWHNAPYIGVGPSAAGFVDGCRYTNVADVDEYIARIEKGDDAVETSERIGGVLAAMETVMVQLRLVEGIDLEQFHTRTGFDLLERASGSIQMLRDQDLLECGGGRLKLSRPGLLVADAVIAEIAAGLDDSRGDSRSLTKN